MNIGYYKPRYGNTVMGRQNLYKKCPRGQKISPTQGWRVVNILNKPAISSYIVLNLQPLVFIQVVYL